MTGPLRLSSADVPRAAERLRAGQLVAFPTETVYGLGASALDPAAVQRVFALKGRPSTNPLIVHVASEAMACDPALGLVAHWPDSASRLARAFWPGPLTLIVPRGPRVPEAVTAGGPGVALRCPDHPVARALLLAFGGPLVGPSANRSGTVSPTTADHVAADFPDASLAILDGGPCRLGLESTVLSLLAEPRVLRPGHISPDQLAKVLGEPVAQGPAGAPSGPLPSPGLLDRHYAPKTPAFLFSRHTLAQALAEAPSSVILSLGPLAAPAPAVVVPLPTDPTSYARDLYAALRHADTLGLSRLLIEQPPADAAWSAILDRLRRACS